MKIGITGSLSSGKSSVANILSKNKNLLFSADKEVKDLYPQDNKCPVFKTPFIFGGGLNEFSPSLDRINNKNGYVSGNVQWISAKANTIKRNATIKELYALADYLKNLK